jgi:hypothetical protein
MLKTMVTIAALALAQVVQLSAAHAGNYPSEWGEWEGGPFDPGLPAHKGGAGQGSGGGSVDDPGLPAHNNSGGDIKSPPTPQLSVPAHIPPKIHGPLPGPIPGAYRTQ